MGINDKDYADALEHQRLHERALMQLELEKQIEERKMANVSGAIGNILGAGTTASTVTLNTATNATWTSNMGAVYTGVRPVSEQDLNHEAMKAPLSALVDMWTMRWQGEWVSEQEFQEDEFWRLALIRLVGANKLEKHNLANQYHSVYRIIE